MKPLTSLLLLCLVAVAVFLVVEWAGSGPQPVGSPGGDAASPSSTVEPSSPPKDQTEQPQHGPAVGAPERAVLDVPRDERPEEADSSTEGCKVRGRLVDQGGEPVVGATVRLKSQADTQPTREELDRGLRRFGARKTKDEGRFELRQPLIADPYVLSIDSEEYVVTVIEPRDATIVIPAGQADLDLGIRVRLVPREAIRGFVVDMDGKPLAEAAVYILNNRRSSRPDGSMGPQIRARADDEGRFTLYRWVDRDPADPDRVRIGVEPGAGHQGIPPGEPVSWGTTGLVLRLDQGASCQLEVVSASTGKPIEDYGWTAWSIPGERTEFLSSKLRDAGQHEAGRLEIGGLREGSFALIVWPEDRSFAPSEVVQVEIGPVGRSDLKVVLDDSVPVTIRVLDGDGQPIPGAVVRLGHVRIPTWKIGHVLYLHDRTMPGMGNPKLLSHLLDEGRSDGDGKLVLHALPYAGRMVLSATTEGCEECQRELPVGQRNFDMIVSRTARIHGRCTPVDLLDALVPGHAEAAKQPLGKDGGAPQGSIGIKLIHARKGYLPIGAACYPVDAEGRFDITDLPAGSYTFYLMRPWEQGKLNWHSGAICHFELTPGDSLDLGVDLTPLIPVAADLLVTLDGSPLPDTRVFLTRMFRFEDQEGGWLTHEPLELRPDAAGRCKIEGIVAGRYQVQAVLPDPSPPAERLLGVPDPRLFQAVEPIVVRSDQANHLRAEFVHRPLRLRILEADGETPAAGRAVQLHCKQPFLFVRALLEDDGEVLFDPGPTGPFEVTLWSPADDPHPLTAEQKAELPANQLAQPRGEGRRHGPLDPTRYASDKPLELRAPAGAG